MKVKVRIKHAPLTQVEEFLNQTLAETQDDLAAALTENERLFQEKRDAERNLVIAERDFQDLKRRFSDVCAERDNATAAYKQVCASLGEALQKIAGLENDAGIHEEEKAAFDQIVADFEQTRQDYEKEIKRLRDEKQAWINCYEELRKDIEADRVKAGEICNSCDEIYQRVLKQRNEAWEQTKKLQNRIAELELLLTDAQDTIVSLRTQIELKPKFTNLWNLLQENGLIINTMEGIHNNG